MTDEGEAQQTAMLLTQPEWEDLAAMVSHYRQSTNWVDHEVKSADSLANDHPGHALIRRRALAQRIIEAV